MSVPSLDGLSDYLSSGEQLKLSDWVWGLSRWGQRTLVLAAVAVAEPCLQVWERGVPGDEWWSPFRAEPPVTAAALSSLRRWMKDGRAADRQQMEEDAKLLRKQVQTAEFIVDEGSGTAERVAQRERSFLAGRAVLRAIDAAIWTADAVPSTGDEAEHRALIETGPAYEVWEAVAGYRACFPDQVDAEVRALIRQRVLEGVA